MLKMIYCVMLNGQALTPEACDVLLSTALSMLRSYQKRKKIKSNQCEGYVSTRFERARLGTLSGAEFTADIATEKGMSKVTYLLRDQDIKDIDGKELIWCSFDPTQQTLKSWKSKLHANQHSLN